MSICNNFTGVDGIEGFAIEMQSMNKNWLKKVSDGRG